MSRFILREDGSQLLREDGTAFLREDGDLSLQLSESLNLSATGSPSRSSSVTLSESLNVNIAGRKVVSASVSLSESLSVSISATPVKQGSATLSESFVIAIEGGRNNASISEAFAVSAVGSSVRFGVAASAAESFALTIKGRKVVSGSASLSLPEYSTSISASPVKRGSATISETFRLTVGTAIRITEQLTVAILAPDLRPPAPTAFKSVRSGSTITLTWQDSIGTATVEVYRAQGQREPFSLLTTLNAGVQTLADTPNADVVASYQLKPIAPNGAKGRSSYIVYNAPNSQIL